MNFYKKNSEPGVFAKVLRPPTDATVWFLF